MMQLLLILKNSANHVVLKTKQRVCLAYISRGVHCPIVSPQVAQPFVGWVGNEGVDINSPHSIQSGTLI